MLPMDYGKTCGVWDKETCEKTYPSGQTEVWCCMPWCFVDAACPAARNSTLQEGLHYSDLTCEVDEVEVATCKYSDVCKCVGQNTGLTPGGKTIDFNYGKSCDAWDAANCKANWEG